MLELIQFDTWAAYHIHGLEETLHALPHVLDRFVVLVLELRRQWHLVIAEDLADFSVTGRMLLQVKLVKDSFIGVGLAHASE